jgi:formate hydrogenlyase subunit 6/NADH:ubiquinone oxidoreductase subunit I
MFDILRKIWSTGTVTKKIPFEEAPPRFRGKPIFVSNECTGCEACTSSCPSNSIQFYRNGDSSKLSLSYSSCIFCGICAEVCETQMIQITNEYGLATKNKSYLIQTINVSKHQTKLLTVGKRV